MQNQYNSNNFSRYQGVDEAGPNWSSEPYQTMGYQPASTSTQGRPNTRGNSWSFKPRPVNRGVTQTQTRVPLAPVHQQQQQQQTSGNPRFHPYQKSVYVPQQKLEGTQPWGDVLDEYEEEVRKQGFDPKRKIIPEDGLVQTSLTSYKLVLSKFKDLSICEYKGNAYAHIWARSRGGKSSKVSLNFDEMCQLIKYHQEIVASMEVMMLGEQVCADMDCEEAPPRC